LKNIVVFASGSGTNFQSVIDAVEAGAIDARITGLLASRDGIGAIRRAEHHDIPFRVLHPAFFTEHPEYETTLLRILDEWSPDLIVLAGYMIKIPDSVIHRYAHRIINIHPSLLPKYGGKGYYGIRVHRAVIENDEKESGCTVHEVNEAYDQGPILGQIRVEVRADDTPESLAQRVLAEEHKLLPGVIADLINSNSKS